MPIILKTALLVDTLSETGMQAVEQVISVAIHQNGKSPAGYFEYEIKLFS